jgi:hypothetical protein
VIPVRYELNLSSILYCYWVLFCMPSFTLPSICWMYYYRLQINWVSLTKKKTCRVCISVAKETHLQTHCLAMVVCSGYWSLAMDVFSSFIILALRHHVTMLYDKSVRSSPVGRNNERSSPKERPWTAKLKQNRNQLLQPMAESNFRSVLSACMQWNLTGISGSSE